MSKKNCCSEVYEDEVDFDSEYSREYVFIKFGSDLTSSIFVEDIVDVIIEDDWHYITCGDGSEMTVPAPGLYEDYIVYLVKTYKS